MDNVCKSSGIQGTQGKKINNNNTKHFIVKEQYNDNINNNHNNNDGNVNQSCNYVIYANLDSSLTGLISIRPQNISALLSLLCPISCFPAEGPGERGRSRPVDRRFRPPGSPRVAPPSLINSSSLCALPLETKMAQHGLNWFSTTRTTLEVNGLKG